MTSKPSAPHEIRYAVETLLTDFATGVDRGDAALLSAIFAEDAELLASGIGLAAKGRAAIVERLFGQSTKADIVFRHFWTNLRIVSFSADAAEAESLAMTLLAPRTAPHDKQLMCGEAFDLIRRSSDGTWRFASRRLEVVFPFAEA